MYVAPPMRMGAWSMACVLRQRIEYYYYYCHWYNYVEDNVTMIKLHTTIGPFSIYYYTAGVCSG